MRKKVLSIVLSLALVVTMIPALGVTAFAGAEPVTLHVNSAAASDDAARGANEEYKTIAGALAKAESGDTIVLDKDAKAETVVNINKNITINLNGNKLYRELASAQENGNVLRIESGCKLTIKDTSESKTGVITGGNNIGVGGCCLITSNGELVLESGTISGNKCMQNSEKSLGCGTIYLRQDAKFTMNGGTIKGNYVENSGGAVYLDGEFCMNGGTISDNKAGNCGGGIYVYYGSKEDPGVFKMAKDAVIKNNYATDKGGGIYVDDYAEVSLCGTITGNNSILYGGGVCCNSPIEVGGTAKIVQNTQLGVESNVVLRHDIDIIGTSAQKQKTGSISISSTSPLAAGACIGVTYISMLGLRGTGEVVTSAKSSDANYFFADGVGYTAKYNLLKKTISTVASTGKIFSSTKELISKIIAIITSGSLFESPSIIAIWSNLFSTNLLK